MQTRQQRECARDANNKKSYNRIECLKRVPLRFTAQTVVLILTRAAAPVTNMLAQTKTSRRYVTSQQREMSRSDNLCKNWLSVTKAAAKERITIIKSRLSSHSRQCTHSTPKSSELFCDLWWPLSALLSRVPRSDWKINQNCYGSEAQKRHLWQVNWNHGNFLHTHRFWQNRYISFVNWLIHGNKLWKIVAHHQLRQPRQ